MGGFVIWLTGLSGAGKSTLAKELKAGIQSEHKERCIEILDGDEIRKNLSSDLGFSKEDRGANIKRIGYVANLLSRNGVIVIVAAISPYRAGREEVRNSIENFVEVYCECPINVLKKRDPKGLYKRVEAGEIENFTGISDPYEPPIEPEIWLRTDFEEIPQSIKTIMLYLEERVLI
jgi:adenylylsulfate kinase